MENRIGARKTSEVPSTVLDALNKGEIATVNLVESLAMDQVVLLKSTIPATYQEDLIKAIKEEKADSYLKQVKCIGATLYRLANSKSDNDLLPYLMSHKSDTVRCWATIWIGSSQNPVLTKLNDIKPLAADKHFGVREIAWIAVREDILNSPEESIEFLSNWVMSSDENIRRFASESIRPKGVWCRQFKWIQEHPEAALRILDALKDDPTKYVQDSVANWLNDLSKTNPSWVQTITQAWLDENPNSKNTAYICRRAIRSIAN